MAAYVVTDYVTDPGSVAVVMAALEVLMDATISDTKTIHYIDIIPQPDRQWVGVIIADAE